MKRTRKEPTRIMILQEIFEHFQQVTQWVPGEFCHADHSSGVLTYLNKAEALIEVLEICDCGSTGGFDPKMPTELIRGGLSLYERFLWLVNKYNNRKDIQHECNFTLESLYTYFLKMGKLREEILCE